MAMGFRPFPSRGGPWLRIQLQCIEPVGGLNSWALRRRKRQGAHSETALLYLDDDFPNCCDIRQNSFSLNGNNIV
jgi:hypothetical protein